MNKLNRCVLAVSLGLSFAGMVSAQGMAQEASQGPKILQITREFTKPGKAGDIHDQRESAFVQAMTRAKWPTHYTGLTSLSGKQRAIFITSYDSFEAWEKDNAAIAKNATLSAELDRAGMNDGELLDSVDQGVFEFNADMSLRPMTDHSRTRFLEISSYHVRPGHGQQWRALVKLVKDAYEKGVPDAHWGMYEQMYGGDGGTYLVFIGHQSLAEVDQAEQHEKDFVAALGEDGMKKLVELESDCVKSSQHQLLQVDPHMSYVPEEWIKSDPEFWKPKPAAHMAKPAAESKKPNE
jgi:hypothetical protein